MVEDGHGEEGHAVESQAPEEGDGGHGLVGGCHQRMASFRPWLSDQGPAVTMTQTCEDGGGGDSGGGDGGGGDGGGGDGGGGDGVAGGDLEHCLHNGALTDEGTGPHLHLILLSLTTADFSTLQLLDLPPVNPLQQAGVTLLATRIPRPAKARHSTYGPAV